MNYKSIIGLLIFLFMLNLTYAQRITPFQSGSYIPLLTSLRDFSPAPQGLYLLNYNYVVSPKSYSNRDGKKINSLRYDVPGELIPDIGGELINLDPSTNAFLSSLAFYYSSKKIKKLGGARYSAIVSPSYQNVDYQLIAEVGDQNYQVEGELSGMADLFIQPVGLSWSFQKKVDLSAFYSLYLPTGRYNTGSDNNLGMGHVTHQIQVPLLVYFNDQSTALLMSSTLELSGEFVDRQVRPGNRLSIEYGVSQYVNEWLELELMNAHNFQVGQDRGADAWWVNTPLDTYDRKNMFSLGVGVWPWKDRMQFRLRYVHDYVAVQRMNNDYFSLAIFFDPNWLKGGGK